MDLGLEQWRSQPENLVMLCKSFRVHRPFRVQEMNNDNDLIFAYSETKLSG
jgi:hypothetical protein